MGPAQLLHGYIYFISHTHTQFSQVFMHLQCVTQCALVCAFCVCLVLGPRSFLTAAHYHFWSKGSPAPLTAAQLLCG